MRKAMIATGATLGALGLLGAGTWALGATLPREHEASASRRLGAPVEEVFARIGDRAAAASWRSDVERVDVLPDVDGHARFVEHGEHGPITYEEVEREPPHRIVTRIADPELPFGGAWEIELTEVDGGTSVTITERGWVDPPLFRALSQYVFGHDATLRSYLDDLDRSLGR